jgi:hypothetical protein
VVEERKCSALVEEAFALCRNQAVVLGPGDDDRGGRKAETSGLVGVGVVRGLNELKAGRAREGDEMNTRGLDESFLAWDGFGKCGVQVEIAAGVLIESAAEPEAGRNEEFDYIDHRVILDKPRSLAHEVFSETGI